MTSAKYFKFRGIVKTEIGVEVSQYGIRSTIFMTASAILISIANFTNFTLLGAAAGGVLFGLGGIIFGYLEVKYSGQQKYMLKYIDHLQQSGMDDEAAENDFYFTLKLLQKDGKIVTLAMPYRT